MALIPTPKDLFYHSHLTVRLLLAQTWVRLFCKVCKVGFLQFTRDPYLMCIIISLSY